MYEENKSQIQKLQLFRIIFFTYPLQFYARVRDQHGICIKFNTKKDN